MAELLSPGIYIEEVPSQINVTSGVTTSTMGIVGWTKKGPVNEATLVTSYPEFDRIFGGLTRNSYLPISMAAYFANGGRRAYVVRVVPSDASDADGLIGCKSYDFAGGTGDGILAAFAPTLPVVAGPVRPSSVSIRWREDGVLVAPTPLRNRANTANVVGVAAQLLYEGRIDPTSLPAYDTSVLADGKLIDPRQFAVAAPAGAAPPATPVVPGEVYLTWQSGGNPYPGINIPRPAPGGDVVTVTTGPIVGPPAFPGGTVITFSWRTGFFSINFNVGEIPQVAQPINVSFTPTTADKVAVDNGAGVLTGDVGGGPNTIAYATGIIAVTMLAPVHNLAPILIDYETNAWDMDPTSAGTWGNGLRLRVRGNVDNYDAATATYSKFDVLVYLQNDITGDYEIVETYEALDFDTATDVQYFADVLNELSDYINIVTPAGDLVVGQLNGVALSQIVGGGDELPAGRSFSFTLDHLPTARTVVISFADNTGAPMSITDDGAGLLVGDVDPTATNTIDYTTGAVVFTTVNPVDETSFVTIAFREQPEESLHSQDLAGGTDGTFSGGTWGRNQFTNPTLQTTYGGVYALDRVDEIMQVIIPDFAGDVTITGDLLDYAELRAALPQGGDRYIILTVPRGSTAQEAVDWLRYDLGRYSKFAALYWPWVKVADPLSDDRPMLMPALAHIAGIYARTDANRNVGKAPGGTVDGALRYLLGLEVNPSQGDRDLVYPSRINPLISSVQTGLAVWGVRQIAIESEWRYINARRLFMFLEKSVFQSTFWIVFEANGPALWAKIKQQLDSFFGNLFAQGYFAGNSPSQAYFIICDDTNNTPATIDAGQVIIDIGVAPNKPAEFVRFRFTQKTLT